MEFLHRHKRAFIVTLSVICLIFLIFSAGERFRPGLLANPLGIVVSNTAGFFTGIGNWVERNVNFLRGMNDLAAENADLRERIFLLETEFGRLLLVEEENRVLADLLAVERRYSDFPTIGANIIARDPGNWFDTFMIDRGSRDGLRTNMVVLAPGGLAGTVINTGWNHATVITLIDYSSSVGAESRRTGDWGILSGDIALMPYGYTRMEFFNSEAEFAIGDEIITSAMSSIYPPGIMIGHIADILTEGGSRYAIVRPVVDFSRLSTLLIITELFEYELIDEE